MQMTRTIALVAVAAGLVSAAPALAHGGSGGRGHGAQARYNVPSRVANRVKRAEKALDRAAAYADDGNDTSALSALGAVRKNMSAALKAAKKRVAASASNGPDSAASVASAQHDVISQTTDLFDGASDALVDGLNTTLNGSIDGRDELIAAIAALSDHSDYADVLDQIDSDVTDEIDSIDSALADDTLTQTAQDDLNAAKAKLQATQTTVEGLGGSASASNTAASDDTSDGSESGCDHGS